MIAVFQAGMLGSVGRLAVVVLMAAGALQAAGMGSLAEQLAQAGLDPATCYRVRDLPFTRGDDLRFYLNDGFLIFGKPVEGRRISAVFTSGDDTGDAEVIVMPPTKGERLSLASFTEAPNMNEHFRQALLLFTDDTADVLLEQLKARPELTANPERGALLAREWQATMGNIARSFTVRLVHSLGNQTPVSRGFFYAAIQGRKLGNFDLYYEPDSANQIYAGALRYRDNRAYYDTWSSFEARPFRTGARKLPPPDYAIGNYRIEAVLEENLHLRVVTRATVRVAREGLRVLAFDITQGMQVKAVRINGDEAEIFAPESLRANLIRHSGSVTFLVEAPQPLAAGRSYEFEIEHEGDVVRDAGRGVLFVGSRSNWYPRAGSEFATFDVTFTYPATLQMVFPGEVKEDTTDGPLRITRRVTDTPIRLAGFNLGHYESAKVSRGNLSVEVFANKQVEPGLARQREMVVLPPPSTPFPRRQQPRPEVVTVPVPAPNPLLRLETLANEVAGAFEFLAAHLGPPALPNLMVAPIPGAFGQGFSGLVYLSTWSYLNPNERPPTARNSQHEVFFSELLPAHETAHQWWGNVVTSSSVQDDWLMEALANYSSLLLYEKKKGSRAMQAVLEHYRTKLLDKDQAGHVVDSVGPLRLGPRLQSSLSPDAWHTIVYGKGSWVVHMLRRRLGDEKFITMLGDFCKRFRYQTVSVDQFREIAAGYLPPGSADPKLESFFEAWVESTGIPALTLDTSLKGKAPKLQLTLTVNQSGVEDTVSLQVPVDVELTRGKSQTYWLTTGNGEPATLTIPLRTAPVKVTLDPERSLLRQ